MTKEGAARKSLVAGGWKLVRDEDINISSSLCTAVASVENLNRLHGDCSAIVNANPGRRFPFGVTQFVNLHIATLWLWLKIGYF